MPELRRFETREDGRLAKLNHIDHLVDFLSLPKAHPRHLGDEDLSFLIVLKRNFIYLSRDGWARAADGEPFKHALARALGKTPEQTRSKRRELRRRKIIEVNARGEIRVCDWTVDEIGEWLPLAYNDKLKTARKPRPKMQRARSDGNRLHLPGRGTTATAAELCLGPGVKTRGRWIVSAEAIEVAGDARLEPEQRKSVQKVSGGWKTTRAHKVTESPSNDAEEVTDRKTAPRVPPEWHVDELWDVWVNLRRKRFNGNAPPAKVLLSAIDQLGELLREGHDLKEVMIANIKRGGLPEFRAVKDGTNGAARSHRRVDANERTRRNLEAAGFLSGSPQTFDVPFDATELDEVNAETVRPDEPTELERVLRASVEHIELGKVIADKRTRLEHLSGGKSRERAALLLEVEQLSEKQRKIEAKCRAALDAGPAGNWDAIQPQLKRSVNPHSYSTWFRPARELGTYDGAIVVAVPTKAFAKRLRDTYGEAIRAALASIAKAHLRVEFVVVESERQAA